MEKTTLAQQIAAIQELSKYEIKGTSENDAKLFNQAIKDAAESLLNANHLHRCINCQILGFQKAVDTMLTIDAEAAFQLQNHFNNLINTHPDFKEHSEHLLHISAEPPIIATIGVRQIGDHCLFISRNTTCECSSDDIEPETDDDGNDQPEYYQCIGCGWSSVENPGLYCPRCTGASIEGVY